jgi:predicted nucleotidyltransferase
VTHKCWMVTGEVDFPLTFNEGVDGSSPSRPIHLSLSSCSGQCKNETVNPFSLDTLTEVLTKNLKAQAILLYGSYAQNLQDEQSDIDLLIIVKKIPYPARRRALYEKIPHATILEVDPKISRQKNGWDNSWSPTNDKLLIDQHRVEIGYNTVAWVNRVVENLIVKHRTTFKEFPFRPYTFLGLLETCKVLFDKENYIEKLKSQIRPMPQPLKLAIIQEFLPILLESHEELKDYSTRNIGILAYQFHLFRAIDALIQIILALNETYDPAFKRMEPFLFGLKLLPPHFENFILHTLPKFYEKQIEVSDFFEKAINYLKLSNLIDDPTLPQS